MQILRSLVVAYFSPDTVQNQPLRQCLSYFFPVYCYSSPLNQRAMQRVSCDEPLSIIHYNLLTLSRGTLGIYPNV